MSGRASTPRPPIYRRLSVVNSPNSPISGRNPGGELTAPIKRRYSAVFRRQPRSRVQDARGFFLMGIVFGFLLWLWVWLVFLFVLSCFVLLDCFWLCMASFSVCSLLACLSFCLVPCPVSVLIAFLVRSGFLPEFGTQKARRHSGADCFPDRSAVTGAISIRSPSGMGAGLPGGIGWWSKRGSDIGWP